MPMIQEKSVSSMAHLCAIVSIWHHFRERSPHQPRGRGRLLAAGCWLLAAGCWLLAAGWRRLSDVAERG
jgi:hypothetical protein